MTNGTDRSSASKQPELRYIAHNTSDDAMPFARDVTERRGVFQYVRRVPKDVAQLAGRATPIDIRTFDRDDESDAWNWLANAKREAA